MANEIKISLSITAEKKGAKFARQETFQDDMTGDAWVSGIQQVGTGSEALVTHADIATYGWVYLKNLDGTNIITVKTDGAVSFLDLSPGEFAFMPVKGAVGLEVQANTATCILEYGYWSKG